MDYENSSQHRQSMMIFVGRGKTMAPNIGVFSSAIFEPCEDSSHQTTGGL